MASLKYWLWLTTRRGLSNEGIRELLNYFGTPEAIHFAADREYNELPCLSRQARESLIDKTMDEPNRILSRCEELGQRVLTMADAGYPERLRNIEDPPAVLYLKGRDISFDEEAVIALIGTRKPSGYGIAQAQRLGHDLAAQGAVVVTGLAQGLDSEGARGALRGGGVVCGVMGCGLDVVYPKASRFLLQDVAATGLLISEYPPGTPPKSEHFPPRNRIISGLSLGVVVVEGGYRSGTSITAHSALDQGRDVFAVPGPVDGPMSYMPNLLIRKSEAKLITSATDVLEEYEYFFPGKIDLRPGLAPDTPAIAPGVQPRSEEPEKPPAKPPREAQQAPAETIPTVHWRELTPALTDDQRDVMLTLRDNSMVMDELIEATQIPARRCVSAVTMLQLAGFVREELGKRFAATVRIQVDAS